MPQHVYARISGFGWTLLPLAPFRIGRLPDQTRSVLAVHDSPSGPRDATVTLNGEPPAVELGLGTTALEEVLDLQEGPGYDHWRIETALFTVRWPDAFVLISDPRPPGFYFRGPGESLLYLQGPFPRQRLPALTEMAAPGQTVLRHGRSDRWGWVELGYQHEGHPWRQTHRVVDFEAGHALVVTAQTLEQWAELADAAAQEVAESLSPEPPEE